LKAAVDRRWQSQEEQADFVSGWSMPSLIILRSNKTRRCGDEALKLSSARDVLVFLGQRRDVPRSPKKVH